MERCDYEVKVPAKWVLSGEHAVLRGSEAIAFPHPDFSLILQYRRAANEQIFGQNRSRYRELFSKACALLGTPMPLELEGELEIQSTIPQGAGLGSSAALCVAITRFAIWHTGSDSSQVIRIATQLEDGFHGKSSGMDVNAIVHHAPILFSMNAGARPLDALRRVPVFRFSDSGLRGKTRECVEQVNRWRERSLELALQFDLQMQKATELAVNGLESYSSGSRDGLSLLKESMELSQNCLETWGLITPELFQQKQELLERGAKAVKLTGAGLGGFWVSLWEDATAALDNFQSENIIRAKR